MKKFLFILLSLLYFSNNVLAQNEFGLKFGLSSYDLPKNKSLTADNIKLSIQDASYGFQAGVYGRIGLLGLYIQPEVLFNSNSVNFKIDDLNNLDTLNQIRTSSYKSLDIPVLFMITPSILKIYTGPVAHYLIDDISDFTKKDKLEEMFENLTYGYQLGVAASLGSLTIDVRYEGSFNKRIKTFIIDNQEFHLDDSPSRFIFSLWFRL